MSFTSSKHPAKFSDVVLSAVDHLLGDATWVLDPFAGVGTIHQLYPSRMTVGIEIEPEWALQHERTMVGNALNLLFPDHSFDAVATSPSFGNRMSDHHDAKDESHRHTYRHYLGRPLHPLNSGQMQWGKSYREFHEKAWVEASRVARDRFVLNISDHVRKGQIMPVTEWHVGVLTKLGWTQMDIVKVSTRRMRHGANADLRVEYESVILFRR